MSTRILIVDDHGVLRAGLAALLDLEPDLELVEKPDGLYLQIMVDKAWACNQRKWVTTDLLGKAKTPDLPYAQPDGSSYCIDTDFQGRKRKSAEPCVGPFEFDESGKLVLKVW